MNRWPALRKLLLFALSLWLAACGSFPSISTEVDYCCRPAADRVRTFRVEFEDMPEFLKPMLRDEASVVLAAKGLDYTEGDADAILKMSFIGTPVEPGPAAGGERIPTARPASESRYQAEVRLALTNSVTADLIISGSMYRVHDGSRGSYMHEAPARKAMRSAFAAVFMDFPDRVFDER